MTDEQVTPGFWHVNVGHLLTILTMLCGALAFFMAYDHQIRDNTSGLLAYIQTQNASNLIVNQRIAALEEARMRYDPKLERIDEKLSWITEWIKEQKIKASNTDRGQHYER